MFTNCVKYKSQKLKNEAIDAHLDHCQPLENALRWLRTLLGVKSQTFPDETSDTIKIACSILCGALNGILMLSSAPE